MRIALRGPCDISGYGNVYRTLVQHLAPRVEMEVCPLDNFVHPDWPVPLCERQTIRSLGVLIGHPTAIHQIGTSYRVLYTMTEVSDIPDDWKDELRYADEVWVPTQFSAEVFACYHPRVKIVPVGYDETIYHQVGEFDREAFWSEVCPEARGKFVVGTAGVMSMRKGIDVLLKAWSWSGIENAVLVVKTRDTRGEIPEAPNTFVIDADWPYERLADFYRALDLYVLPTRAEGLGLPPLEAAACGTPSLVTRASGPLEYVDDRGIYGIEVATTSRVVNMAAKFATWFEPDPSDLLDKMRAFCYDVPKVEHAYRQWSMGGLTDRWVTELQAVERRASVAPGRAY